MPEPTLKIRPLTSGNGSRRAGSQPAPSRSRTPINPSKPPKYLNKIARDEWQRVVRELVKEEAVTVLDGTVLALYAVAFARWIHAEDEVRKLGLIVKSPAGIPMQNPFLSVATSAMKTLVTLGRELGLSPAARGELCK